MEWRWGKLEGNVLPVMCIISLNLLGKIKYLLISLVAAIVPSLCTKPDRRFKNDPISVSLRE